MVEGTAGSSGVRSRVEVGGQQVTQVSAEATGGRNKVRRSWASPTPHPRGPEAAANSPHFSCLWQGSVECDSEVGSGHVAFTSLFPPDPSPAVTFVLFHETQVFTLSHGDGALTGPCHEGAMCPSLL